MGSSKNEKWLEQMKRSVNSGSNPLPDNFWGDLQRDIPAVKQSGRGTGWWWIAAAALLLIGYILFPTGEQLPVTGELVADVGEIAVLENPIENPIENMSDAMALNHHSDNTTFDQKSSVESSGANPIADSEKIVEERDEKSVGRVFEERVVVDNDMDDAEDAEVAEKVEENRKEDGKISMEEYLAQLQKEEGDTNLRSWVAMNCGTGGINVGMSETGQSPNSQTTMQGGQSGNVDDILINRTNPNVVLGFYSSGGAAVKLDDVDNISLDYNHKSPVKMQITFAKEIKKSIFIESGISYQYLKSSVSGEGGKGWQYLHYVGVPLKVNCYFLDKKQVSFYAGAGYLLEKCIYGEVFGKRINLKEWQNSINGSVGVQLNFNKLISLYLEPGISHTFGMGNEVVSLQKGYKIEHYYSEEPTRFSAVAGLRFSF